MFDAKNPSIDCDITDWVPIVATIAILELIGGSIISTTALVKVLTGALTPLPPISRRCAKRNGWSMSNHPSANPKPYWPI